MSTGRITTRAAALRPPRSAMAESSAPMSAPPRTRRTETLLICPPGAASRCAALCAAPGASLDRQRQNVGGVSRRNGENQVRASALCQPRRCHPVCAVGTRRSFYGTIRGFDFKRCAGHRLIRGEPVEINLEIFAADNRNDLERVGIGLAAWQRTCRDGRLFPVVMALVGGSGGDRAHRTAVTARARRARPKWESILVVLQSELPSLAGSTRHASQTQ